MKKYILVLCAVVLSCSSAFAADDPVKKLCLKDANQTYRDALSDARFDFKLNQATCKFGPTVGACYSTCFTDFRTCIQPAVTALQDCRKSCADTLDAARDAAKQQFNCGNECTTNSDYQKAVIQARLAFYSCQNECRKDDGNIAARAACRTVNAACNKSCRKAE